MHAQPSRSLVGEDGSGGPRKQCGRGKPDRSLLQKKSGQSWGGTESWDRRVNPLHNSSEGRRWRRKDDNQTCHTEPDTASRERPGSWGGHGRGGLVILCQGNSCPWTLLDLHLSCLFVPTVLPECQGSAETNNEALMMIWNVKCSSVLMVCIQNSSQMREDTLPFDLELEGWQSGGSYDDEKKERSQVTTSHPTEKPTIGNQQIMCDVGIVAKATVVPPPATAGRTHHLPCHPQALHLSWMK